MKYEREGENKTKEEEGIFIYVYSGEWESFLYKKENQIIENKGT